LVLHVDRVAPSVAISASQLSTLVEMEAGCEPKEH
jgi:hypothetical protein